MAETTDNHEQLTTDCASSSDTDGSEDHSHGTQQELHEPMPVEKDEQTSRYQPLSAVTLLQDSSYQTRQDLRLTNNVMDTRESSSQPLPEICENTAKEPLTEMPDKMVYMTTENNRDEKMYNTCA